MEFHTSSRQANVFYQRCNHFTVGIQEPNSKMWVRSTKKSLRCRRSRLKLPIRLPKPKWWNDWLSIRYLSVANKLQRSSRITLLTEPGFPERCIQAQPPLPSVSSMHWGNSRSRTSVLWGRRALEETREFFSNKSSTSPNFMRHN